MMQQKFVTKGTVCVAKINNPTKSRCDFEPISEDYFESSRKSFEIYIGALCHPPLRSNKSSS